MTFKGRLTAAAAIAVAIAIALASFVVYVIVRRELHAQLDSDLRRMASSARYVQLGLSSRIYLPDAPLGGAQGYAQLVSYNGRVLGSSTALLPVPDRTLHVARGDAEPYLSDMTVDGVHVRVFTTQVAPGVAAQLARPLEEVDTVLARLRWILVLITAAGVALATGLGGAVARATLAPVRRLTEATEHVSTTSDLTHRIEVEGNDELSRLAGSFNAMLDALERSIDSQRQLVADASHELRTPLTSLRTNIEVLANEDRLSPEQRDELRRDIVGQLEELTALIGDIVELARGNEPESVLEEVRLDDVVIEATERARKREPGVDIEVLVEPRVVAGSPMRLERALNNLLDNAIKWSPPGERIEVRMEGSDVTVKDNGPGIAPEDLPHIFDRFYRSRAARNMPGSGLGLAIARQVAESHGGQITVESLEGGGALFRLYLPAPEVSPQGEPTPSDGQG